MLRAALVSTSILIVSAAVWATLSPEEANVRTASNNPTVAGGLSDFDRQQKMICRIVEEFGTQEEGYRVRAEFYDTMLVDGQIFYPAYFSVSFPNQHGCGGIYIFNENGELSWWALRDLGIERIIGNCLVLDGALSEATALSQWGNEMSPRYLYYDVLVFDRDEGTGELICAYGLDSGRFDEEVLPGRSGLRVVSGIPR